MVKAIALWLVLGTSSSEAALPSLMDKMQKAGCEKSVVGLGHPCCTFRTYHCHKKQCNLFTN
jgi:Na+/H+-dicarboxylate symporter